MSPLSRPLLIATTVLSPVLPSFLNASELPPASPHVQRATPLDEPLLLFEDDFSKAGDGLNAGLEERQSGTQAGTTLKVYGAEDQVYLMPEEGALAIGLKKAANDPAVTNAVAYERDLMTFRPFIAEAWIDFEDHRLPVGDVDASFVIGNTKLEYSPNRFDDKHHKIVFEFKEGNGSLYYSIQIDSVGVTSTEDPVDTWRGRAGFGNPNQLRHKDGFWHIRIVGVPIDGGTLLRFYIDDMNAPVETHFMNRRPVPNFIGFANRLAKNETESRMLVKKVRLEEIPFEAALEQVLPSDYVMRSLNLDYPGLEAVKEAWAAGEQDRAKSLFIDYFRSRDTMVFPPVNEKLVHPDYAQIAEEGLAGRYGGLGYFSQFTDKFLDDDGRLRWDFGDGHLNRHYHWSCYALRYQETGDEKYARQFSEEMADWCEKEPHIWYQNPNIFGITSRDGFSYLLGHLNGGNLGRRLEEPWWHVIGAFRKTESWTQDSIFLALQAVMENIRLGSSPGAFLVDDDSGAHLSIAMLNASLLFPEAKKAPEWNEIAWERIDRILTSQFYEDGSHVSLSTGYSWATLMAFEKLSLTLDLNGMEMPQRIYDQLYKAYTHPIMISRPDGGAVKLNDGTWGNIGDNLKKALELFPEREDIRYFATYGEEGTKPEYTSIYMPNAGQFAMRTGWGPEEKYLFFAGYPVGSTHVKNDHLAVVVDIGGTAILTDGGRGTYESNAWNSYASSSRSRNVIQVDNHEQFIDHSKLWGWEAPERRWVTNEHFDFAESHYDTGWVDNSKDKAFGGGRLNGKQLRQVIFIKGDNPPETGYWIVLDTMTMEGDDSHEFQMSWHSSRNVVEPLEGQVGFRTYDSGGAARVLALGPGFSQDIIKGQTEPVWQGWVVHGNNKKPVPVPIMKWSDDKTSTRAFLIEVSKDENEWLVDSVDTRLNGEPGSIFIEVSMKDGSKHRIFRREPSDEPAQAFGRTVTGDVFVEVLDGPELEID